MFKVLFLKVNKLIAQTYRTVTMINYISIFTDKIPDLANPKF